MIAETLSRVCHEAAQVQPKARFVLLTLTVKNCSGDELDLDHMLRGWQRMSRSAAFKSRVAGWFRAVEITHNARNDSWHPHIHALLTMVPSYYGRLYLRQSAWVDMWQDAAGLDYSPVVDIRHVREMAGAAREVGKYVSKPGDYLSGSPAEIDRAVGVLAGAIKGRQLVAYGDFLRIVHKRLLEADEVQDEETGDLVHVGEDQACTCSACGSDLLEHLYRWRVGVNEYVG